MQNNAAVFRTGPVLQEGIEKLVSLAGDLRSVKVREEREREKKEDLK